MYRLITTYRCHAARPVIERGPWHTSRKDAELWADMLRDVGYGVVIETQHGAVQEDNSALADALASMA